MYGHIMLLFVVPVVSCVPTSKVLNYPKANYKSHSPSYGFIISENRKMCWEIFAKKKKRWREASENTLVFDRYGWFWMVWNRYSVQVSRFSYLTAHTQIHTYMYTHLMLHGKIHRSIIARWRLYDFMCGLSYASA